MDRGGRLSRPIRGLFGRIAEGLALWRANRSARRRLQPGFHVPRGIGSSLAVLFLLASIGSGMVIGGHYERIREEQGTVSDMLARALGFGISHVGVAGNRELVAEEVVELSGLARTASLPFLDPKALQEKLLKVPLIAEASVNKLYPDQLVIEIKERVPFALWQNDGHVQVIAEDGTAIEELNDARFLRLPHVVGPDANLRVKEFVALVAAVPELKDQIRAGILVSKRRWTLKLVNGVDLKLPEIAAEAALKSFAEIERSEGLTKRAVLAIDLRLPDRITLRLTEEAASAYQETIQTRVKKWGGRAS